MEVSPGFSVLLVAAAAVVVAEAEPKWSCSAAQKAAHSSDRCLLEGILDVMSWFDGIKMESIANNSST
jgi:hypothetical protein